VPWSKSCDGSQAWPRAKRQLSSMRVRWRGLSAAAGPAARVTTRARIQVTKWCLLILEVMSGGERAPHGHLQRAQRCGAPQPFQGPVGISFQPGVGERALQREHREGEEERAERAHVAV